MGGVSVTKEAKVLSPIMRGHCKVPLIRKHATPEGTLTLGLLSLQRCKKFLCLTTPHSMVYFEHLFSEVLGINKSGSAKDIFVIFTQIQLGKLSLIQNLEML